jgi:hypothetical protein
MFSAYGVRRTADGGRKGKNAIDRDSLFMILFAGPHLSELPLCALYDGQPRQNNLSQILGKSGCGSGRALNGKAFWLN